VSTADTQKFISVARTSQVQKVVTSAHTLPYDSSSTFTLSLDDYYGTYTVFAGDDSANPDFDLRVDVVHNATKLTHAHDLQNAGITPGSYRNMSDYMTPGE
jgi:hypothetical protein